jgi:hypothetical protein
VLEVDEHGPLVVERQPGARSAVSDAVDRLAALAVAHGLPADRPAKRRWRERLVEGEAETAIRAGLERQAAELRALEAAARPFPPERVAEERERILGRRPVPEDADERQALRLLPSSTAEIVHNTRGAA